jgi:L-2-hydroxyglutarate oxidase
MATYDVAIIGGGIVGLATAMELLKISPNCSVAVVEKEASVGRHQTGHNSGVIHSGLYYAPGSLKAQLCREGCRETKAFCDEEALQYETCGKLIVASDVSQLANLNALYERSLANDVPVKQLDADELSELEPNVAGSRALLVPEAGIVDYRDICRAMVARLGRAGAELRTLAEVKTIRESIDAVELDTTAGKITARTVVACAGLQSDRIAKLAGLDSGIRIIPFRGEYYSLPAARSGLIKHLIYPVPDPRFPFLGIHLTRMIGGGITVGPNAVLGFSREGYPKFSFSFADAIASLSFSGTWRLLLRHWQFAAAELRRSLWREAYLAECRRYCPSLSIEDLMPWPAGIRAQAVMRDGTLVDDFAFANTGRMLHVLNAPSPAATSAIPIGRFIVKRFLRTAGQDFSRRRRQ